MPYSDLHEVLPDLAERETRSLIVPPGTGQGPLPEGTYTFMGLYCDEPDCDCRRVLFYVQSSFRPGPEAVIAWGWEPRDFYARWMGDADETVLDALQGPARNLGSPETALAVPILGLVKDVLLADAAYVARVKDHYRAFREQIHRRSATTGFAAPETRAGSRRRPVVTTRRPHDPRWRLDSPPLPPRPVGFRVERLRAPAARSAPSLPSASLHKCSRATVRR